VLFRDALAAYPHSAQNGLVDPHLGWTSGETHTYEFVLIVRNDDRAQGRTLIQSFLWAARPG
jgi:hypothetical protein